MIVGRPGARVHAVGADARRRAVRVLLAVVREHVAVVLVEEPLVAARHLVAWPRVEEALDVARVSGARSVEYGRLRAERRHELVIAGKGHSVDRGRAAGL